MKTPTGTRLHLAILALVGLLFMYPGLYKLVHPGQATGLMFAFSVFLWYLSLLAHPPACGCMGLTGLFLSNRHSALFGIFRNCVILWLLKFAYDYYVKAPQAVPPGRP